MDLNYLIHREGEERLRAAHAACEKSRESHLAMADMFRDRIDFRRRADNRLDAAFPAPHAA